MEHCFENTISPKSFIVPINSLILFSSGLNFKWILSELGFITELIFLIWFIFSSICKHSLISMFNSSLLFHLWSFFLLFSKIIFIWFGSFSFSFMISSPKYKLLYFSFIFNNNSSSLSFKAVLNLVKIFCIKRNINFLHLI